MSTRGKAIASMALGCTLLAGCAQTSASAPATTPKATTPETQQAPTTAQTPETQEAPQTTPAAQTPETPQQSKTTPSQTGALPEADWGDLFSTMGDEYVAFGRRVQTELPTRAYACYQGEGGGDPLWYDNAEDILAIFNGLASSNVSDEVGEIRTDDYTSFGFEFADGTSQSFMFDSMTIMLAENNQWVFYTVNPGPYLDKYIAAARRATMGA